MVHTSDENTNFMPLEYLPHAGALGSARFRGNIGSNVEEHIYGPRWITDVDPPHPFALYCTRKQESRPGYFTDCQYCTECMSSGLILVNGNRGLLFPWVESKNRWNNHFQQFVDWNSIICHSFLDSSQTAIFQLDLSELSVSYRAPRLHLSPGRSFCLCHIL